MTIGLIRPLKGYSPRRPKEVAPVLHPRKRAVADDLPEAIRQLAGYMGETNARTVWRLQKRGVRGTAPELLVYDWLERRELRFEFQSSLFGGRRIRGGLVTDFIVWIGPRPMAWRVQGEHWHSSAPARERDRANKVRIMLSKYNGARFLACVDLWEKDLYRKRNAVCEAALQGKDSR